VKKIIVSDLDGTLLDSRTYSFEAAQPALKTLKQKGLPLVLCTSKTRAEVEFWREKLGNTDPFIVENGGAVYIPRGYFPFPAPSVVSRGPYDVMEMGAPYEELVATLKEAAREAGCQALGFHDLSVAEICLRSHLPVEQAVLAKQREYDEPFEIRGQGSYRLLEAIERRGKRWTRGDRFYHILGNNSKAEALGRLTALFRKAFGEVRVVALGDGWNDVDFLRTADVPVLVRSAYATVLKRAVPRGQVTRASGPHGWNEAVLEAIAA
jgi:mannosyl-3-phosphoglycerate phosphatase